MSNDKEQQDALRAAFDLVEHQGLVVRTVKDGKILIFNKDFMRRLLEKHPDQETLIIFAKDADSEQAKKEMS